MDVMSKANGGRGGLILNVASVAGLSASPGTPVYNATKHGVIGFTRSMAVSWLNGNIYDFEVDESILIHFFRYQVWLLRIETWCEICNYLPGPDKNRNGNGFRTKNSIGWSERHDKRNPQGYPTSRVSNLLNVHAFRMLFKCANLPFSVLTFAGESFRTLRRRRQMAPFGSLTEANPKK